MRGRTIRALVPAAILLAGLSGTAAAQETPGFDKEARNAAESWAKNLISQLQNSQHGRDAGYRLALRPIQRHESPDLNDRHRWQLYEWTLDALERADPRYKLVDRARVSEIYRAMEEVDTEDLERRYMELLKQTQTRINLVCGTATDPTSFVLSCRATDIDTGNRLGGGSVGFERRWLPPVPPRTAAGWIAREIVPRMGDGGVGEIRLIDERTGGASRLSARVAGDLKRMIARVLADRPGFRPLGENPAPAGYRLEGSILPESGGRLILEVDLKPAVGDRLVYSAWEEIALSTVPKALLLDAPGRDRDVPGGDRADPAPVGAGAAASSDGGCGDDPGETVLPSGMTLADWRLLATKRLDRGEFEHLLVEARGHLRNHCNWAPAAEVLSLAVGGLARKVEAGIAADPRSALSRLSAVTAAAGSRPVLLRLRARAHRLLGEDGEEAESLVAWLRAAPQDHDKRGEVLEELEAARKRIALADGERKLGLEGPSRRLVRLGLAAFGHEGSSGTGAFDAPFRAALRSWQDSRKQEPTGWLTHRQKETLIAEGRRVEARKRDDAAFARARAADTVAAYAAYGLMGYPSGRHAAEARRLLRNAQARAAEAALALGPEEGAAIGRGLMSLTSGSEPFDAAFGERFRKALRSWQESEGHEPTGWLTRGQAKTLIAEGEAVEAREREKAERRAREAQRPGRKFRDCPSCPEMVVVPAGSFTMGSPPSEEGHYVDEDPQHEVTIPRPFAVGKYEVTFVEWDACVSAGGCGGHRPGDNGWGRGSRPVIAVSWRDAKSYVGWLSRRTGERYRLLTEAEWEYAARAGTRTRYSWGDGIGRNRANCGGCGSRWDHKQTAPVGSFPANRFGLHDMHGNVWEWVEDRWHGNYAGAPLDGSAWTTGGFRGRVLRGGSWDDGPGALRSADRSRSDAGGRVGGDGFRVARTLTP